MRPLAITAAVLGAAVTLAACGSTSTGANAAFKRASLVAFAQCMRSHGVSNFPDPGSNGNGGVVISRSQRSGSGPSLSINGVAVGSPAFQGAMQSCRSKLPNGGRPPPLNASQRSAMLQFSHCMRTHGVPNFPDPTFGAGGTIGLRLSRASGMDPSSPAFQHAQSTCAAAHGGAFTLKVGPPG